MSAIDFTIEKKMKHQLGRAGVLKTAHGEIHTPAFIPVGTKATVKALLPESVEALGAEAVLANTYHLYLQPGDEMVKKAGGLHTFMNWDGPIFTDSGGFQVFSLGSGLGKGISKFGKIAESELPETDESQRAKITEEGAEFKSYIDGSMHLITPEDSMRIQYNLGADIIFAFDECTSPNDSPEYIHEAMERTHCWAVRSLDAHKALRGESPKQALFGVVQGGNSKEMREESARTIAELDFDGFGIGGSFTKEDLDQALVSVNTLLPEEKPRHLLGIGSEPIDFFVGVENGCDTFDCVAPTRMARNGTLYTPEGRINILNAQYRDDFTPLSQWNKVFEGTTYTRAYLHHLFKAKEILASTLATQNNLSFAVNLVKDIREAIISDTYEEFKEKTLKAYYGEV